MWALEHRESAWRRLPREYETRALARLALRRFRYFFPGHHYRVREIIEADHDFSRDGLRPASTATLDFASLREAHSPLGKQSPFH